MVGALPMVVATFNHVGGSFCGHRGCLNNPSFRILGYVLHVEHSVSSRIVANISEPSLLFTQQLLGFAGGKHYQKITIPIFKLHQFFFFFQVDFLLYSLLFLLVLLNFFWWVVIAVSGSMTVQGTS